MITIFTPTYNRMPLLTRLFQSLSNQSCKNFEWLIVDDGSQDNTRSYISMLTNTADFPIRYLYQSNSGKHVAHNLAIQYAKGDLFLCVDSDDFLSNHLVIQQILNDWSQCKHYSNCAGLISLKSLVDGTLLGSNFPSQISYISPFDLAHNCGCGGERNYIFVTSVIRKFPYPVYADEKFFPDSYITDRLSYSYKMHIRPFVDVLCEYQSDGLSRNFILLMRNNPKGFCVANMQIIDLHIDPLKRFGSIIRYWAFWFLSDKRNATYAGKHKTLVKLCKILGWLYSQYYSLFRWRGIYSER